jgi:hypothetical protein
VTELPAGSSSAGPGIVADAVARDGPGPSSPANSATASPKNTERAASPRALVVNFIASRLTTLCANKSYESMSQRFLCAAAA